MEVLIAVGLAGNVVQFIQGAGALIILANQIRENGRPSSLTELERMSKDLVDQTGMLRSRLEATNQSLTAENQNLLDVAVACHESGTEFIKYLGSLNSNSELKIGKFVKTVTTALKYQWSHSKIGDFSDKIERLRGSLILATVLACRSSTEDNNREIIVHLERISNQHRSYDKTSEAMLDETLIKTLTNGLGSAIKSCEDEILAMRQDILTSDHLPTREQHILRWLDFRQNSWRYDGIDEAYEKTYEWIFDRTGVSQEWDSIIHHLEEDVSMPYFIKGKAGSGKSTLMKYIIGHSETNSCLHQWAGNMETMKLHYFFWNRGTALQRSYCGMLRAFLHTVLQQYPELVPAVLPEKYQDWRSLLVERDEPEPTYAELKRTFGVLIERCHYLKLAIFVDGIDEFEGDHRDMSRFLRSLVSQRVKLVISSRPLNSCLQALGGCPTLRLQDLTRGDMQLFVQGELSNHHLMVRFAQEFPAVAPRLAEDIMQKAEGVFLWVKLVVHLLVHGLENGDTLKELLAILDALPSDLRDLYKRMFSRLDSEYRKQSALIFRLKEEWLDVDPKHEMPGVILWYAVNCPSAMYEHPIDYMPGSTYDFNMSSLAKRLESRCYGLLELQYGSKRLDGYFNFTPVWPVVTIVDVEQLTVNYMHKTVHEFITRDDIWQDIHDLTDETDFTIRQRLFSACVTVMKLTTHRRTLKHDRYIDIATHLCRQMVVAQPQTAYAYLLEMDRTMTKILARARRLFFSSATSLEDEIPHWSATSHPSMITGFGSEDSSHMNYTSIYTYAANQALLSWHTTVPENLSQGCCFALVLHALSSWRAEQGGESSLPSITLAQRSQTLTYLLANVIRPETQLRNSSLWTAVLLLCEELRREEKFFEIASLLRIFLSTAESPRSLWRRSSNHYNLEPARLLKELQHHVRNSGEAEISRLVDEVYHLTNQQKPILSHETLPDPPALANNTAQRKAKRARTRRTKKLAKRAAG